jgi:hypothetical protein
MGLRESRAARQARLIKQEKRLAAELELRQRELALREAELAARNAPPPAPSTPESEADTLPRVIATLSAVALSPASDDATRVRACESWLRATGNWGMDQSAGTAESATLRKMMQNLPNSKPVNTNPEQPADDKSNELNTP